MNQKCKYGSVPQNSRLFSFLIQMELRNDKMIDLWTSRFFKKRKCGMRKRIVHLELIIPEYLIGIPKIQ